MSYNVKNLIREIETRGYCQLPGLYSSEEAARILDLAKEWYEKSKDVLTDRLPSLAKNDPFVWNLQNKDYRFLEFIFRPKEVRQILMRFINDPWFKQIPQDEPNYILRGVLARTSNAVLPMHIDSLVPYLSSQVFVMQVSITLEEQNEENGCTRVVPGSHLTGHYADQEAFDIAISVKSKPGDVTIWDSRIWHGTEENRGAGTRWSIIATYTRWWLKQMFGMTDSMPQSIYEKLTSSQKAMCGFCSIPFPNEAAGVDMKRGYDLLLPHVDDYKRRTVAADAARSESLDG